MTSPGVQWQEFEAMAVDEENSEFDSDHEYGGMMERISDDIKELSELISDAVKDEEEFEVEATDGLLTVYFVKPDSDEREEWWTRMPPDFDLKIDELDELPWPFRLMNPAMALFPRVEELRMPVLWLQRMGHHMTDIAGWAPIDTLILVHWCSDDFFWEIGTNITFRGVQSLQVPRQVLRNAPCAAGRRQPAYPRPGLLLRRPSRGGKRDRDPHGPPRAHPARDRRERQGVFHVHGRSDIACRACGQCCIVDAFPH